LLVFVSSSTQAPLHWEYPVLHVNPQAPATQAAWANATLVEHGTPHPPQLARLVIVLTQLLPHSVGVEAKQPETHE